MSHLRWLAVALVALAMALAACGGEGDATERAGDVERYCELSAELERDAEDHFARLDEGATRENFEQAHVEFIEANEAEIEELREVAPEEITDDVNTVLEGMRAQAGANVEATDAEIEAADERLRQFERENC